MGEKTVLIVGELHIPNQVISGVTRQRVLSVLDSEGCSDPAAITHNFQPCSI